MDDLEGGTIVTGRVTKTTDRGRVVQIKSDIIGHVGLTEIADDYDQANPHDIKKNEIVRAAVVEIDAPNKKISLTTRPSKVLSSTLPVKDRVITNLSQLKVNDVVRGFIKNVADVGLFVGIGPSITAYVKVAELSDDFLKDWKSHFEVHRLVKGKIIMVDEAAKQVQMSLRNSILSHDYVTQITVNDIKPGQIIKGKVRKVEEYGAFIVVDNSHNVSGLCHRKEMADTRVEDATKLYSEGDRVKAIVRRIDHKKAPPRVNFGLKASYFKDIEDNPSDDEDMDNYIEMLGSDADGETASDSGIEMDEESVSSPSDKADEGEEHEKTETKKRPVEDDDNEGLDAGGFDWTGSLRLAGASATTQQSKDPHPSSGHHEQPAKKKRKRNSSNSPGITIDQTELDKHGLRSPSDFERRLLSEKHNIELWQRYMAYYLDASQINEARAIAERALREIPIRLQGEKLDIWTSYMAMEMNFGSEGALEDVFSRACQYSDSKEVHLRRVTEHIKSQQMNQALRLFHSMTHKKPFTVDPDFWTNYADFLFDKHTTPDPAAARSLYTRAKQSVPADHLRHLFLSFAMLEFTCANGDAERGRTMFEGLFDTYPGRWDHWDVLLNLEKSKVEKMKAASSSDRKRESDSSSSSSNSEDIKAQESQITRLYQRLGDAALQSVGINPKTSTPNASSSLLSTTLGGEEEKRGRKIKPKKARQNFAAWLDWEENGKSVAAAVTAKQENRMWIERVKARWAAYDERLVEVKPGKAKAAGIALPGK